ncbi:hypothetical protein [Campylobacter devanensis]|uniref:hypothetical protein n=1 Tax=Campylobacter devanensis TaxID=3161138 RepID=UPI000A347F11|nr:hypothetical protein [Campylobacter sp. P0087]
MAKFNLLNSIYNTIGDIQATNALSNINAFNQPNFLNCDSLRFIATKAFYSKFTAFLQRQDLQMSPTNISPNHFTLNDLYTIQAPKERYLLKITDKIRIYAYYSSISFEKSRRIHHALNNYIILEIHGLAQYDQHTPHPIPHNEKTLKILKFIFSYCNNSKERQALTLKSFDISLDYLDQAQINQEYALKKAPYLDQIHAKFFNYQGTLYIQESKAPTAKNINSNLQKIKIYDKQIKNSLSYALNRFELIFLISD